MNAGVSVMARKQGDGPTPEQLAKGGYKRGYVTHVESNTLSMAHVSRHDPVERWKAAERLSQAQLAAIELCQRLWTLAGLSQPLTASYGERMAKATGNVELRALNEIEAREDLHRIQDYIPPAYWQLFENVCRFGESAEAAGERLNFGKRSAADRAHQTVCFVADVISMKERL
jgi:hypothetical protein